MLTGVLCDERSCSYRSSMGGNSNRWCPRGVSSKHSGHHSLGSLPPSLTKLTNFWTEVESQGMPSHGLLVEDMTLQEQIQSHSTHGWISRMFLNIFFEVIPMKGVKCHVIDTKHK